MSKPNLPDDELAAIQEAVAADLATPAVAAEIAADVAADLAAPAPIEEPAPEPVVAPDPAPVTPDPAPAPDVPPDAPPDADPAPPAITDADREAAWEQIRTLAAGVELALPDDWHAFVAGAGHTLIYSGPSDALNFPGVGLVKQGDTFTVAPEFQQFIDNLALAGHTFTEPTA